MSHEVLDHENWEKRVSDETIPALKNEIERLKETPAVRSYLTLSAIPGDSQDIYGRMRSAESYWHQIPREIYEHQDVRLFVALQQQITALASRMVVKTRSVG